MPFDQIDCVPVGQFYYYVQPKWFNVYKYAPDQGVGFTFEGEYAFAVVTPGPTHGEQPANFKR